MPSKRKIIFIIIIVEGISDQTALAMHKPWNSICL